jgi:hypothetical protein
MYQFNLPVLAELKGSIFIISYCAWSRDSHSLAQLPVAHSRSIYSPQISTTYWNSLAANGPLFSCLSLITDWVYVPAPQLDHPSLHSEPQIWTSHITQFNFPVSASFPNFATCISPVAFNGTKGGHNQQVSMKIVMQASS